MSLAYRKLLRDAVLPILAAGFNPAIDAMAADYGITPFTVDFSTGSTSFALSRISYANIEQCQLTSFSPVAGCMYTGAARNTKDVIGYRFSGPVILHIQWWLRSRDGVESFDTESILDAAEDATMALLDDPAIQWPAGVILGRGCEVDRSDIAPLGDGWAQAITISIPFEVYVL